MRGVGGGRLERRHVLHAGRVVAELDVGVGHELHVAEVEHGGHHIKDLTLRDRQSAMSPEHNASAVRKAQHAHTDTAAHKHGLDNNNP